MAIEKRDFIFEFSNFIFKFLTWGYIAEILIVICFIFIFFSFIYLVGHIKIFRFLVKDRIKFMNNYLYSFFSQKTEFIKSFFYTFWKEVNKPRLIFIICSIIAIIGLCIWLFTRVQ